MKNIYLILGIGLVVVAGGYIAMTQNKQESMVPTPLETTDEKKMVPSDGTPVVTIEQETSTQASGSMEDAMAAKSFTVIGTSFTFDVKEMKVKKGDKVTVTFNNSEGFHDWVIDEFNAKTKQLPAGEEETISFVADKVGTFEYYCSVGQHRANGMVGKLIVE